MEIKDLMVSSEDDNKVTDTTEPNKEDTSIIKDTVIDDTEASPVINGEVVEVDNSNLPTEEVIPEGADDTVNYAKLTADLLIENNVLDKDSKVDNFDELIKAFDAKDEDVISNYLEGLPNEVQELIKYGNKGMDVSRVKQDLFNVKDLEAAKTAKLDTDTYKKYIKQSLMSDGYSEEYVNKRIESAEDTDSIKLEGDVAIDRLLVTSQARIKREEEENIRLSNERKQQYDNWVNNTESTVNTLLSDRYKINQKVKTEVLKSVLEPVEVVEQGGNKRPISYLEKALQEDPGLLAEINYLIIANKIGSKADSKLIESKRSNGIAAIEKAFSKSPYKKEGDKSNNRSLIMNKLKLN